jgi:hypothetical protein
MIRLTGDSHTWAIAQGLRSLQNRGELAGIEYLARPLGSHSHFHRPFFTETDENIEFTNPEIRKFMTHYPVSNTDDIHLLCMGFHSVFLFEDPTFRTNVPLRFWNGGSGSPMSRALWLRIVENHQKYYRLFFDALRRRGLKVIVIEAPKPFAHHKGVSLARRDVVYEVDRSYRAALASWLEERSILVVNVDPQCLNVDGFMHETFRHPDQNDGHHGNEMYGQIMARRIVELAKSNNFGV